jgi:hypothetical protein
LYEILANGPRHGPYPLPWADNRELDHVSGTKSLRELLENSGLRELNWIDLTAEILQWGKRALAHEHPAHSAPIGIDLVIGEDHRERTSNLYQALRAAELRVVLALYQPG